MYFLIKNLLPPEAGNDAVVAGVDVVDAGVEGGTYAVEETTTDEVVVSGVDVVLETITGDDGLLGSTGVDMVLLLPLLLDLLASMSNGIII